MDGEWWVYRVRTCWVQVGALHARRSGAVYERPEFTRVDGAGCWFSSMPCWPLLTRFLSNNGSGRVSCCLTGCTQSTRQSAPPGARACKLAVSPAESTLPIG